MYQCPSCQSHSVPSRAAWESSVKRPALCSACGELSYVPAAQSQGPLIGALFIVLFGGIAAGILQSTVAFGAGCVLAMMFYVWRWRSVALVQYLPEDLVKDRRGLLYGVLEAIGMLWSWH